MIWWEALLAASFAPFAVWALWRAQTFSVEQLRRSMVKLTRHHAWLYTIVSWFGTLIHELSHASVLLLSGHGIKAFNVKAESGHVTPRRLKRGPVSFLFFLAAALAPLFIPPALVLGAAWLLLDRNVFGLATGGVGLEAAWEVLRATFATFPQRLVETIGGIDLATGPGVAFVLLVMIALPSSRPSHVKGSRFHGTKDEGDIAVLRARIRANPWPLILFMLLLYAAYFLIVPRWPGVYWTTFQVIWSIAIAGAILALVGAVLWRVVAVSGRIKPALQLLPLALFVAIQVAARVAPSWPQWAEPLWVVNASSVAVSCLLAVGLVFAAPRRGPGGWK